MLLNRFLLRMILQTSTKASENEDRILRLWTHRDEDRLLPVILLTLSFLRIHSIRFFSFKKKEKVYPWRTEVLLENTS